jgi:ribose/xylose/arabinose/galactoside ABC-type transport system permease subunit
MSAQTTSPSLLKRIAAQREYGVLALLILTVGIVAFNDPSFLDWENIQNMLVNAAPYIIIGCGLTLVIVTGEIDISVGSLVGLLAAIMGLLTSIEHPYQWPVPVAVLLVLALGAAIGLLNGFLVTIGKVPSIIVTLGMLTALRGVNELILAGEWVKGMPDSLRYLGTGSILGLPISIWVSLVVVVIFIIITLQTPLGRRVYAVGSNPRSAKLAGVSETRIKLAAFAITGLLAGVATVVFVTRLSSIDAETGKGWELLAVTCVVVGGTSISGGKGTIVGTLLGAILLNIISTALIFMKLGDAAEYWARAIQGAFILMAVLADHLLAGKREGHA